MKRLFWITVVLILVSILLHHATAGEADEAATARRFCEDFLASDDDAIAGLMDEALAAAMTPAASQQVRDVLSATLGPVKEIGQAWHVDEIQGYTRYRVPVRFRDGMRDLLVAFAPNGKVGGLFTVDHVEAPAEEPPAEKPPAVAEEPDAAGDWIGKLEAPGSALEISITLRRDAQGWSGTIDVPAQALLGHPLEQVQIAANEATFKIANIPGDPTFKGTVEGNVLSGTLTQSGATVSFSLKRGEKPELSRPQTPQPPFDYGQEDVTYKNDTVVRAGTLTIPNGDGPFPAVLLLSGSGAQDRDSLLFGHRPFLLLADHLTRAGIAVLRVDDRGVGGSNGNLSESTLSDFAEDALSGVRFLAGREELDAERIGLIGHSEGGIVAPLAASRSNDVAFVVMLAGTGVPGSDVMNLQMQLHMRLLGIDEATIEAAAVEHRKLNNLIREGATAAAVEEQLAKLKQAQGDPTPVQPAELAGLMAPWTRTFITHDPRPVLADVKVPVLALNGELDFQVDPDQNLEAIGKALKHNPDVTLHRLPRLNHLFQTAETGALAEYGQIEETFAPAALDLIRDWILDRSAPRPEEAS